MSGKISAERKKKENRDSDGIRTGSLRALSRRCYRLSYQHIMLLGHEIDRPNSKDGTFQ